MASKKVAESAPDAPAIDITSDAVVLTWVGPEGRSARNTPARDLTHNDIARLAFVKVLSAVSGDVGQPVDPEDPDSELIARPDHKTTDQAVCAEVIEELVATGLFEVAVPRGNAEPVKPAEVPTDTTPAPDVHADATATDDSAPPPTDDQQPAAPAEV